MNTGNSKIGTRMGLAALLFLSVYALCTWIGISGLRLVSVENSSIINDGYRGAAYSYEIIDIVNRNARSMRNALIFDDPLSFEREKVGILKNNSENDDNCSRLKVSINSARGKDLLRIVLETRDLYGVSQNEFMELVASGRKAEAKELLLNKLSTDQRNYFDALRELIRYQTERVRVSGERAENVFQTTRAKLLGLAVLSVVLGIGVSAWLSFSIILPLRQAVKIAGTVASGDLSSRIEVKTRDETGLLLKSLKEMNDSLVRVVSEVRSGADTIATSTSQISAGNQDLSVRTAEQAASLEQTAASMTELTETVRQNAENARQANSLAVSACELAGTGRRDVDVMVETINQINADSARVAEITGMIEGIAFQTNILALNAAVEAARAGEQGRGFAVVAGEVRSLAQRASAAAKEIKDLIEVSTQKVSQGARRAGEVSIAMDHIHQAVSRVSDVVAEISAASLEQTQGIEQVHQAIDQIDEVTQQNAALVEESAAAAQSMQEQAGKMKEEVMFFKLGVESGESQQFSVAQAAPI